MFSYRFNNFQHREAISYYDKALKIAPNDINILYNKALALGNLGLYREAITYYDKVISINPADIDAIIGKAEALVGLELYQEANFFMVKPKNRSSKY